MDVLFIHPNFPSTFFPIAQYLVQQGWPVTMVTSLDTSAFQLPFNHLNYRVGDQPLPKTFRNPETVAGLMDHLLAVYKGLRGMQNIRPDLVVGHMSYGTMLYLRTLYSCPFVGFFEMLPPPFWSQELTLRKEFPPTDTVRIFNATYHTLAYLHLHAVDAAYTHTRYQRGTAPAEMQHKIEVLPEGVDCNFFKPEPLPRPLEFRGIRIGPETRVVTYVSPGLESVRGFDIFMKAARIIAAEVPDAIFLIAGDERTIYGHESFHLRNQSFKQYVLAQEHFDLERFHFLGIIPYAELKTLYNLSDVHVYLTVPHLVSVSMLQAMASGCVVVGSATAPVQEFIENEKQGLLTDFYDVDGLARRAIAVLSDKATFQVLGDAARELMVTSYEHRACLEQLMRFFRKFQNSAHDDVFASFGQVPKG